MMTKKKLNKVFERRLREIRNESPEDKWGRKPFDIKKEIDDALKEMEGVVTELYMIRERTRDKSIKSKLKEINPRIAVVQAILEKIEKHLR